MLGASTIAGARVWQRDLRLRLVVGPLDRAGFNDFLPGGLAARALPSMLAMFTGLSLEYGTELVLLAADRPNVRPGGAKGPGSAGPAARSVNGTLRSLRARVGRSSCSATAPSASASAFTLSLSASPLRASWSLRLITSTTRASTPPRR